MERVPIAYCHDSNQQREGANKRANGAYAYSQIEHALWKLHYNVIETIKQPFMKVIFFKTYRNQDLSGCLASNKDTKFYP